MLSFDRVWSNLLFYSVIFSFIIFLMGSLAFSEVFDEILKISGLSISKNSVNNLRFSSEGMGI